MTISTSSTDAQIKKRLEFVFKKSLVTLKISHGKGASVAKAKTPSPSKLPKELEPHLKALTQALKEKFTGASDDYKGMAAFARKRQDKFETVLAEATHKISKEDMRTLASQFHERKIPKNTSVKAMKSMMLMRMKSLTESMLKTAATAGRTAA